MGYASFGDGSYLDTLGTELGPQTTGTNLFDALRVPLVASPVVAIIDTGITVHPDLDPHVVSGYDFISDPVIANDGDGRDPDPSDPGDWVPVDLSTEPPFSDTGCQEPTSSFHGTHVAGTVAAVTGNGVGGAGSAPVRIQALRTLGRCGGWTSDIAAAIIWAAGGIVPGTPPNPTPASVINMSLGGESPTCDAAWGDAIDYATSRGTSIAVAAGNSNAGAQMESPANCPGVVAVAATDEYGARALFSSYGPVVDIAAPGVRILSTVNLGPTTPSAPGYDYSSGTSMATPHVAGAMALLLAARPGLAPVAVEAALKASATPFKRSGRELAMIYGPPSLSPAFDCVGDDSCGAGYLNTAALLGVATAPGPPTTARYSIGDDPATPGSARVSLAFDAPRTGASVYEIGISSGAIVRATSTISATSATLSVPGLDPADPTIAVLVTPVAVGVRGVQTRAMQVPSLLPSTPAAPELRAATAQHGGIHVAAVGGFATPEISRITVTAQPGGSPCEIGPLVTDGSCALTELDDGTTYTLTAIATNAIGPSGPSAPMTATPAIAAPPGTPGTPTVVPNGRVADVQWAPSVANPGAPIVGYIVNVRPTGSGSDLPPRCIAYHGPLTQCGLAGIPVHNEVTVRVTVVDTSGGWAVSVASDPFTLTADAVVPSIPRSTPTAVAGPGGSGTAVVSFLMGEGPADWGSAPSDTYGMRIVASPGGAACDTVWDTPVEGTATCTISGLTEGTPYTFTAYAYNSVGLSPPSDPTLPLGWRVALSTCAVTWSTDVVHPGESAQLVTTAAAPDRGWTALTLERDGQPFLTYDPMGVTASPSNATLLTGQSYEALRAMGVGHDLRASLVTVDPSGAPTGTELCRATLTLSAASPTTTTTDPPFDPGATPPASAAVVVVPAFTG